MLFFLRCIPVIRGISGKLFEFTGAVTMSFKDMPDLGPLLRPGAKEYADDCLRLSRVAVAHTKHILDVPYGSDFFQKLDIFLPEHPADHALPVLLFLHGGAWKNGFKEWLGFMAPPLVSLPAIFVSANYRLAPTVKFPAPLDDACDALAWVWRNISGYGGDPRRIFVGGHSSGGHLAALMTFRSELIAARGLSTDCVKACFALSAAFNLERKSSGPSRSQMLDLLLEKGDSGAEATPLNYTKGNKVPIYIAYGTEDLPELVIENERMVDLLRRENCTLEHHVFDKNSHFDTNIGCADPNGPWVRTVRQWMTEPPAVRPETGQTFVGYRALPPCADPAPGIPG
jgi:acetyl esterase/lipase